MFNKLSLKFKILAMVIPLGFFMSLASIYMINDFKQQEIQLAGLAKITDAFNDFGELMNALQFERAQNALYLAKSNVSQSDLENLYKEKTDAKMNEVKRMIKEELPFKKEDADQMVAILETLTSIRQEVIANGFSIEDMRSAYGSMINELMLYEGVMTKFYSGKGIEIHLVNMTIVEKLKDNIGKARGAYSVAISKNIPLNLKESGDLQTYRSNVLSISEDPGLELVPAMKAKVTSVIETPLWQDLQKNMDTVLEKSHAGNFGIDSKTFYTQMSEVNQKINDILSGERSELSRFSNSEMKKANTIFFAVLIFVILTICGITTFCWHTIRELIKKEADDMKANQAAVRSASMVDNSSVSTMMCDLNGMLIYINPAAISNLQKLQAFLNEKTENLIGKSADLFHHNSELQSKITGDLKNLPFHTVITLGTEKLDITLTASIDAHGNALGVALLWTIITSRVELIRDLSTSADDLADAANNVLSISSNLSTAAEETSAQANTASVASEEVNAGVQTVAGNMDQMVSAIREITKTTNEAATMTSEAMKMANNTNQIINKLGDSSMDIGNVIKVISSIAQQTNLLALNATIEAARAGEAGKGFAVVANEVKELANQTAKATNEITKKIETIQADSKSAITAIGEISIAIDKVNGFTGNIAASVEEQAATTNEVTRIVTEAAEGVRQITENISQVSQAAANTGKDANSAQEASRKVENIAESLKKYVARLKLES